MFGLQKIQIQNSQEIQTKHNDDQPSDAADMLLIGNQHLADEAGRGPECHEDR